jgi:hypothetical protein
MTDTTVTNDPPVDPAIAAAAAAAQTQTDPPAPVDPPNPDPASTAATTDPETPPAPVDKPHGNKGAKPWFLQRISEESEARRQTEAQLEQEREARRNAETLLQRLQKGNGTDPATTTTTHPPADESAIETRARQIAEERVNGEKIISVIQSGISKFNDWDDKMGVLSAVGAATPAFALDVHSVDPQNAHTILYQLAGDPEKAARLAKMDPRTRTIELVKMSMALQGEANPNPATAKPATPARQVSKAPPPPPPVEPGAAQQVDWRTDPKISDAEWSKQWEANARERANRRSGR